MSDPPSWLRGFGNAIAAQFLPPLDYPPVGCHFCEVAGVWEIALFVSDTEVVGGAEDGVRKPMPVVIDLFQIAKLFQTVTNFTWQTFAVDDDDDLGCHVTIEGLYDHRQIRLRLLSKSPASIEPGASLKVHEQRIESRW